MLQRAGKESTIAPERNQVLYICVWVRGKNGRRGKSRDTGGGEGGHAHYTLINNPCIALPQIYYLRIEIEINEQLDNKSAKEGHKEREGEADRSAIREPP